MKQVRMRLHLFYTYFFSKVRFYHIRCQYLVMFILRVKIGCELAEMLGYESFIKS